MEPLVPKTDAPCEFLEPFIEHQGERRGFWLRKPRRVGDRLLIARKGTPVPDSPRVVVFLDIRGAFGTGGHGTTEGCLLALEKHIRGGESVLDAGTGTGILAIAAHKLGAGRVTAIDIDRNACEETRRHIALNGIAGGIEVIEGGFRSVRDPSDIIVANLRTHILVEEMEVFLQKQCGRGIAIFSGILERELPAFLGFLGGYPLEILEIRRVQGWMTVTACRIPRSGS